MGKATDLPAALPGLHGPCIAHDCLKGLAVLLQASVLNIDKVRARIYGGVGGLGVELGMLLEQKVLHRRTVTAAWTRLQPT